MITELIHEYPIRTGIVTGIFIGLLIVTGIFIGLLIEIGGYLL